MPAFPASQPGAGDRPEGIRRHRGEGRIELRNFGVFQVKDRKPRKARNPKTGEAVDVPGRLAVSFKAGKEMEERVRTRREVASGVESAVSE